MEDGKLYKLNLEIPFKTSQHAEIAYDALRLDAEPPRSTVQKTFSIEKNKLIVNFTGTELRNFRTGVNSFFEHVILVNDTMDNFGPPVSAKYDHYNA